MAGSRRTETADVAVISRREAIMGALALTAGSLIASRPATAAALYGDPVVAGGSVYAASGNTFYLNVGGTGAGTEIAQAMVNRNGTIGEPVQAFGGIVMPAAPTGSAGVWGFAWDAAHYGVHAEHYRAAGVALKVIGRVSLSRSGKATITKGHSGCTVTVASGVDPTSLIVATLQGSAGTGVYLRYAKRANATTFTIKLNKAATATVSVAWFIIG